MNASPVGSVTAKAVGLKLNICDDEQTVFIDDVQLRKNPEDIVFAQHSQSRKVAASRFLRGPQG